MPTIKEVEDNVIEEYVEDGGLSRRTKQARARQVGQFSYRFHYIAVVLSSSQTSVLPAKPESPHCP